MQNRWLEWSPPSLCGFDFGITEALGLGAAAAGAGEAAAVGSTLGGGLATAAASSPAWLPSLSTIGTVASIGGTLLQANAQADNSAYNAAIARNEAAALAQKANEDAAAGERVTISRARQTGLALSRSQALAAASGTDALSPDIINSEEQIAQQGGYNALSSLYEGLARSRSDTYQSTIDLFKASQIERAAPLAIGGTVLSGLSNFIDRRSRLKYYTTSGDSPLSFGLA